MASRLNPYLNFDGNAAEALTFYQSVFGGESSVMTFGQMGTEDPEFVDKVMHGQLETDKGFTLMASDMPPGMPHTPGNTMSVSLSGEDGAELRGYWDQLTVGGTVTVPLEKQMWGDEFGMVIDAYGVPWLVNISQPQS